MASVFLLSSYEATAQTFATTLHVAKNGNDSNDGLSEGSPVLTIGRAVALASQNTKPALIKIAAGTYASENLPITLTSDITLRGGPEAEDVIVDAAGKNSRIFNIVSAQNVGVETLTVRNGNVPESETLGPNGGAIYVFSTNGTMIKDVIFDSNTTPNAGGGLFTRGDIATQIEDCTFRNNQASIGGGLCVSELSNADVVNNVMHSNYADSSGGGVYVDQGTANFYKNRIFNNRRNPARATGAGGITSYYSTVVVGGSFENANDVYDNTGGTSGTQFYVHDDVGKTIDARYNYWGDDPSTTYLYPIDQIDENNWRIIAYRIPLGTKEFYVSPNGDNDNNGSTPGAPWKTITYGLTQFFSTDLDSMTIHIAPGTYSEANGETFPIHLEANT